MGDETPYEGIPVEVVTVPFTRPTRIAGEPFHTGEEILRRHIPGYVFRCPHCGENVNTPPESESDER